MLQPSILVRDRQLPDERASTFKTRFETAPNGGPTSLRDPMRHGQLVGEAEHDDQGAEWVHRDRSRFGGAQLQDVSRNHLSHSGSFVFIS